jgi:mRNA-degrading endonuclease toxin of MazEF toxin-antitoxin module
MAILQGEIYWVHAKDLDIAGSEQQKNRPYVIVSRSSINALGRNVVGVPLTTVLTAGGGYRVQVPVQMMVPNPVWPEHWPNGSPRRKLETSIALVDHIRVLDINRLTTPKMGDLSSTAVAGLELALQRLFESPQNRPRPPVTQHKTIQ